MKEIFTLTLLVLTAISCYSFYLKICEVITDRLEALYFTVGLASAYLLVYLPNFNAELETTGNPLHLKILHTVMLLIFIGMAVIHSRSSRQLTITICMILFVEAVTLLMLDIID